MQQTFIPTTTQLPLPPLPTCTHPDPLPLKIRYLCSNEFSLAPPGRLSFPSRPPLPPRGRDSQPSAPPAPSLEALTKFSIKPPALRDLLRPPAAPLVPASAPSPGTREVKVLLGGFLSVDSKMGTGTCVCLLIGVQERVCFQIEPFLKLQ